MSKAVAVAFLLTLTAWAEDDEPGRGVARLSLIYGDVSMRRGDSGEWIAASVNAPLVVEDHVLTGAGSRAEVQFDWANMLRLSSDADVRLSELEQRRYQVQVARGTVTMRVLRDTEAEVEVNTPNVSVRPLKRGTYRITVFEAGDTEVTVRSGETEIYTPRGVQKLRSGQTMLVRGTSGDPEFQILEATARDDWDRWNEDRDKRLERAQSYAYVSRDIYGADDLDYYGNWSYVAPYGHVWSPYAVGVDWAPYRHGRWVWVDWYGWSWVSYDPWGWAPFHYGRWFHHGNRWCWYPGPRHNRHYWRPGLVAFFGFGSGPVHVGFGFGRIGWVPLAPYEPFHPWYGRGIYRGRHDVRIVNNINITNVYRNARVSRGITDLDSDGFVRGRPGRAFDGRDFRGGTHLMQGAVPLTPVRESLRVSDREGRVPSFGRDRREPQFFTRRQPARVERVPFEDQRRGMETMVRRNFGEPARIAQPETANQGGGNWRRLGSTPRSEDNAIRPRTESRSENADSWRRFGSQAPRMERPAESRSESNDGGWRRFERRGGDETPRPDNNDNGSRRFERRGGEETPRVERPGESRSENNDSNWRRFERRGGDEMRSEPRQETRQETPRFERPQRMDSPRFERQESIRINPPIVRERSESPRMRTEAPPRMERSGGGGGGGESRGSSRSSGDSGGGGGRMQGTGGSGRRR